MQQLVRVPVPLRCWAPFLAALVLLHLTRCPLAGMMDAAYFVGRRAIIDWLNSTFAMSLSKIEETASGAFPASRLPRRARRAALTATCATLPAGAVVCQLLDAIYPGDVPVQKGA